MTNPLDRLYLRAGGEIGAPLTPERPPQIPTSPFASPDFREQGRRVQQVDEELRGDPWVTYPFHQQGRHYASGSNSPSEIEGVLGSGFWVGVAVPELSENAIQALEDRGRLGLHQIFVDSGAFSEVAFDPGAGRFVVVKEITDAEWAWRLNVYLRLAIALGPHVTVVAPDLVGDQVRTLERLQAYVEWVRLIRAWGAQIIVPHQQGALSLFDFYRRAVQIIGDDLFIIGTPMKKDATTTATLREFARDLRRSGAGGLLPGEETGEAEDAGDRAFLERYRLGGFVRFHLLGMGPKSDRYEDSIAALKEELPNVSITTDSVRFRAMVGRGVTRKPRPLTAAQDALRTANPDWQAAQVKTAAIMQIFRAETLAQENEARRSGYVFEGEEPEEIRARLKEEECCGCGHLLKDHAMAGQASFAFTRQVFPCRRCTCTGLHDIVAAA